MPPRRAEVTCLQCANNATYKGVVSLTDDRVESFEHIPGVQANFTVDEFLECDEMLRTHPDVHGGTGQARHHRSWTSSSWTPGPTAKRWHRRSTATAGSAGRTPGGRPRPAQSPYAHPVSGLHCVIDVNSMELLRVEDNGGVDEPNVMGEYVPKHIPERIRSASRREPLKALHARAARRAVVHPRRQPAAMAELVAAYRLQLSRGDDAAHRCATATATGIALWHTGCRSPR